MFSSKIFCTAYKKLSTKCQCHNNGKQIVQDWQCISSSIDIIFINFAKQLLKDLSNASEVKKNYATYRLKYII